MTPLNRFIHIVKYFKNNFIFFIFFGSLVGISEYLLITNVYELYLYFLEYFEYKIAALIILITAYALIIFLGLFLIFLSQRQAFVSSLNYVHHVVLQERPLSYIRNPEELTRALNIERERLAREIISPLQNICIKIALPIAAIFVVLNSESINPFVLAPPFFILILAFLLSSSMFAIYAKKLEKALSNIGSYTYTFVKTFDSNLRFKTLEDERVKSKGNIYQLASTEGFIDSFSQLPRHAIDFCIFGLIVYGFLWESSSGDDLLNIIILSPLFLRAISSVQAIYRDSHQ